MKKLLFALLATPLLLAACSEDSKSADPTIAFAKTAQSLTEGSVTLDLTVSNTDLSALTTPVTIPVTFSGSAIKDNEYSVSAEQFVLGGSNQSLSITVTATDNYNEAKEIIASIGSVAGFRLGNSSSSINLGQKTKIVYSFHSKTTVMSTGATVQIDLYDASGSNYSAPKEITIPISVDTDKSTAVEGTHFEFAGAKQVVIAQGKSSGTAQLTYKATEKDKDLVVIKADLENNKGFVRGTYNSLKVSIFGSYFDKLKGTWKMSSEGNYDPVEFAMMWGSTADIDKVTFDANIAALPAYNANDRLVFTDEGLTTTLESTLKNFFRENSGVSKGDELILHGMMGSTTTLQLILLDNANRYFSATEQSQDTEAYIGVHFKDGDPNKMEMYFVDYNSKSFIVNMLYYETKPTNPDSPYMFFTFDRVTE